MAKSRQEILETELEQLHDIIAHQFIERDICLAMHQADEAEQVNEELRLYLRRKEAVEYLLNSVRAPETERDFDCIITIEVA